ncbi:zinc finger protein RFP-like [Alligator mississippiensis]|uniref:zinc finger protein RFP-like n=1 Tax=Alligator mississippiensis TaxID=8496 RepID=UPI0028772F37|nr:zinc finger protein RFP-like [Alligator mississippiensis]
MAAADPAQAFEDEASCSVCLKYFEDPVTLDCGDNFCRACITQCWEGFDAEVSCPQCRESFPQKNFRPNRQLGNLLELLQNFRGEIEPEQRADKVCQKHQEPLKLFCEDDQTLMCLVCVGSAHEDHSVVPMEEAAQEYKEQIWRHLDVLEEEKEEILALIAQEDEQSQELLKQTEIEKEKMQFQFERLHRFLEKQERLFLAWLEELERDIETRKDESITQLSEKLSCLDALLRELEEKCEEPAMGFLEDARSTLNRCETERAWPPALSCPETNWRIWLFSQNITFLQEALEKLQVCLLPDPKVDRVSVTLDPDTAFSWLRLSPDRTSVNWGVTQQEVPDSPERFDAAPCVLGCEGFTSGRHYWEVEVGEEAVWVLGVAKESVKKKGGSRTAAKQGIWAVRKYWEKYQALTSPETTLHVRGIPTRIRIYLDYERGLVAFYDAGNKAPIFTFPPGSFTGETIRPFFELLSTNSQVILSP